MSTKFQRDAASVPSTRRKHNAALRPENPRCPLCGSRVTYQGATKVECEGAPRAAVPANPSYPGGPPPTPEIPAVPACPNYRPPQPASVPPFSVPGFNPFMFAGQLSPASGSRAWASQQQAAGHNVRAYWPKRPGFKQHANPDNPLFADPFYDSLIWEVIP